ncbi:MULTISPECIES: hypothetical protein [Streptosporangium]|uniref:WD40 repeat domain-containing protein n=1 Tax=Streptosporangium brasiliense TaxID=47480 RepID=A0ABT9QXD5_9ACTN|nr:hypothetical protein [Streptosporangium brasiliense]MDP9861557.1 hypothetical protein [Streptosporangium brasiliense]
MSVTPGIYRLLGCAVIVISVAAPTSLTAHAAGSAPAVAAAPAAGSADLVLPGTRVTVREEPADPLKVTSYTLGNVAYLRRSAGFAKQTGYQEITVGPRGAKALAVPTAYNAGHDWVLLADLAANNGAKVQTVDKPLVAKFAHWSRNGTKAVLTVQRKNGAAWDTTGFVIVDATAKTARAVAVTGVDRTARFRWSPDGAEVVAGHQGGTRFYGQDGRIRRTLVKTGIPAGGEDVFSPSGRALMTWCPATYTEHVCFWDRTSGRLAAKANIQPKALLGWWDDKHFIAVVPSSGAYRAVLADLRGRAVRVLADISAEDWANKVYLSYTRR